MRLMLTDKVTVLRRHGFEPLGWRYTSTARRQQRWWVQGAARAEELPANFPTENLAEQTRHRIADLLLHVGDRALDDIAIGERLEPRELSARKTPRRPVERPDRRPRLRRQCPRRAV